MEVDIGLSADDNLLHLNYFYLTTLTMGEAKLSVYLKIH